MADTYEIHFLQGMGYAWGRTDGGFPVDAFHFATAWAEYVTQASDRGEHRLPINEFFGEYLAKPSHDKRIT